MIRRLRPYKALAWLLLQLAGCAAVGLGTAIWLDWTFTPAVFLIVACFRAAYLPNEIHHLRRMRAQLRGVPFVPPTRLPYPEQPKRGPR